MPTGRPGRSARLPRRLVAAKFSLGPHLGWQIDGLRGLESPLARGFVMAGPLGASLTRNLASEARGGRAAVAGLQGRKLSRKRATWKCGFLVAGLVRRRSSHQYPMFIALQKVEVQAAWRLVARS